MMSMRARNLLIDRQDPISKGGQLTIGERGMRSELEPCDRPNVCCTVQSPSEIDKEGWDQGAKELFNALPGHDVFFNLHPLLSFRASYGTVLIARPERFCPGFEGTE